MKGRVAPREWWIIAVLIRVFEIIACVEAGIFIALLIRDLS